MSLGVQGIGGGSPSGTPGFETGSYTGSGSGNVTLTFSRTPKFITIFGTKNTSAMELGFIDTDAKMGFRITTGQAAHNTIDVTVSGKNVSFTNGYLDRTGYTYQYKAITV